MGGTWQPTLGMPLANAEVEVLQEAALRPDMPKVRQSLTPVQLAVVTSETSDFLAFRTRNEFVNAREHRQCWHWLQRVRNAFAEWLPIQCHWKCLRGSACCCCTSHHFTVHSRFCNHSCDAEHAGCAEVAVIALESYSDLDSMRHLSIDSMCVRL